MNSEQVTAFLQEHWYIASVVIGAVILIGAIRNWNWLCDPTGTRNGLQQSDGVLDEISVHFTIRPMRSMISQHRQIAVSPTQLDGQQIAPLLFRDSLDGLNTS